MKKLYYFDPDMKKWRTVENSHQKTALIIIRALGFLIAYGKPQNQEKNNYRRRKSWLDYIGRDITP